ncbi:hypothetical protein V7S79_04385 [Aquirufa sp. ROCK-SH2]
MRTTLFFLIFLTLLNSCKKEVLQNPPTVLTRIASEIKTKSATLNAEITDEGFSTISERGFYYSDKNSNPTIIDSKIQSGSGKGAFSSVIENLPLNTKFYFKAFATNSKGTSIGEVQNFTTSDYALATLNTASPKNITYTTVELVGEILEEGGGSVSENGFVLSVNPAPTITDLKFPVSKGKGSFALVASKLKLNTKYYVRTYAINEKGIAYGSEQNFTTLDYSLASISTDVPKNITTSTVEIFSTISNEGGGNVTERGFCLSLNANPTVSDNKLPVSSKGAGTFSLIVTSLKGNTKYFIRSYAINEKGIAYGSEQNFTTLDYSLATISTDVPKNITTSTVEMFSTISNEGGGTVSERGFCLSLYANPTIIDNKFPVSSKGAGTFSLVVTSLKENTKYYIRSYAINEKGVAYGNEHSFTTLNYEVPTLKTEAPQNITFSSAEISLKLIQNGGLDILESGLVYGLSSLPTINDTKIKSTDVLNSSSILISNLKEKTKYYVRAYAMNKKGVGYGNEQVFFTTEITVVKSLTGRIWMDRNLGANRVATSSGDIESFGNLYQWGRNSDGHQNRNSENIQTLSNVDNPNLPYFIVSNSYPSDWRNPQNNNLWQGVNGINNVCPVGFRIPTLQEWVNEFNVYPITSGESAFNSILKLPLAGIRRIDDFGRISNTTVSGLYWTSDTYGVYASSIYFDNRSASTKNGGSPRAHGMSIRCIKD